MQTRGVQIEIQIETKANNATSKRRDGCKEVIENHEAKDQNPVTWGNAESGQLQESKTNRHVWRLQSYGSLMLA